MIFLETRKLFVARCVFARERTMSDQKEQKSDKQEGSAAVADKASPASRRKRASKSKPLQPYNVILLDDDDHSYAYVIEMLHVLFKHPVEKGMRLAQQVDELGKAIVFTTHRELAELKRDQIHGYGVDLRVATCAGSMTARIEVAE